MHKDIKVQDVQINSYIETPVLHLMQAQKEASCMP